nr:CGNR zinc finger domain-containing protein [Tamaricihabitans halophyticus]
MASCTVDRDIQLVLDFLNTMDVEDDTDVLRSERDWHAWANTRQLRPNPLPEATTLRAALRNAVGDPTIPTPKAPTGTVQVVLGSAGPELRAVDVCGAVLAAASRLVTLDEWPRVKICPADTCRWAFYDRSRNRSRTWCAMRVCGNRQKARNWRARGTNPDPQDP